MCLTSSKLSAISLRAEPSLSLSATLTALSIGSGTLKASVTECGMDGL